MSWWEEYKKQNNITVGDITKSSMLAPIGANATFKKVKNSKNKDGFFKSSSAFDDGYQAGDILRTTLGTTADVGTTLVKSFLSMGEDIGDFASSIHAQYLDMKGRDDEANVIRQNIANKEGHILSNALNNVNQTVDKYSVIGDKGDNVISGIGQTTGYMALNAVPVIGSALSTGAMFTSAAGNSMSESYANGAENWQAWTKGIGSGLVETVTEKAFGFFGKSGGIDKTIANKISSKIASGAGKVLARTGVNATAESFEEFISYAGNQGLDWVLDKYKNMTGSKGIDLKKDWNWTEVGEQMASAFLSSALTSGAMDTTQVAKIKKNNSMGTKVAINEYAKQLDINSKIKYQKNVAQGLPATGDNKLGQQTILNNNRMIQNGNMGQIEGKTVFAPIKDLNYAESAKKYNIDTNNDTVKSIARVSYERGIKAKYDADLFSNSKQNAIWKISKDQQGNTIREVLINPNSDTNKTLQNIIVHELTHDMEGQKNDYEQLSNFVLSRMKAQEGYESAMKNLKEAYSSVYNRSSDDFDTLVQQEAVADFLGENLGNQEFVNELVKSQNRNWVQKIYNWVSNKIQLFGNKITGNTEAEYWRKVKYTFEKALNSEYQGNNTQSKFSINSNFKTDYDNWNKVDRSGNFLIGRTSQALQSIGLNDYDIVMDKSKILRIKNDHPEMNDDIIKSIPDILENPTLILDTQSKEKKAKGRKVVFGEVTDTTGNPVLVALELNPVENKTNIDKIYKVASAYGKENLNAIQNWLNRKENILYIDEQKNRTTNWLNGLGLQLPVPYNTSSSISSIAPLNEDVNTTKYSMQENENNAQNTKGKWNKFLKSNSINKGTGETIQDVKLAPIGENVKRNTSIEEYNKYKKNIIEGKETQVNKLISYKNVTLTNLDNKILEKQNLLNSKKNKDTKVASLLMAQIERLKEQQTKIQNFYSEKIDKANSALSKKEIEFQTRNEMKHNAKKIMQAEIEPLVQDLTKYKDKKMGFLFNRETAQRNIDDIVQDKELASAIKTSIFDPVQVHQAQKTREINRLFEEINSLNLDKTKKYDYIPDGDTIRTKIDEATLAQLIIEKKLTDKDLRNYGLNDDGIKRIHNVADKFSNILDYLYNRMNEEQVKYGYSPIGKIKNYFPHFFENKPDTMIGKVASLFGIDLTDQSLPTEIAGKTDTFKPGRTWNSNIQERKTNKTDYDALTAMEKYIKGASDIIYTTEDIQKIREYSRQIRYKFSDKGMQADIDKIMNNKELTQEAKDCSLEGIFKNTENELSNFVTYIDDYANTLAGKKSFADRNMERNIGRKIYSSMSGIEGKIAANTIGGNIGVSLTNFAPIFQAAGTTKWNYLITGMLQTTSNDINGLVKKSKDISFITNSTFLTNRFGTDSIAEKKVSQKISDVLSMPMNLVDEFTSESLVRAKYLENIDKGMSEEMALDNADKYTAKIMADRSKGALPLIFNTKNPISKLLTMFQVEPNNIVSNYLKDMPRDAKNKQQLMGQTTKLMIASYAFNTLAMALRGGNEVLPDPIRWVSYLIKALTGDDEEKEKAKEDLKESIIGSVPFGSNLAGLFGMEDIGRVPISNAMPTIGNIVKVFNPENDSKYRAETAWKEFSKPFLYLGLPAGGAQIKKTLEGIATVNAGGSYKTNKEGEQQLQFPVENKTPLKYLQAGLFGKYALSDSKEYANRGYKSLSAKQTEGYKNVQIPYKEFLDYIDNNREKKKSEKIDYINNMKLNANKKWNMYTYDIFSNTERKDGGSQLSDAQYIVQNGVDKSEFIDIYNKACEYDIDIPTEEEYEKIKNSGIKLANYMNYKIKVKETTKKKRASGELKETQTLKVKDEIQVLLDSKYSNAETKAVYESYIKSKNDTEYEMINKTGIDIKQYLKYKQQDFESDKVEDGTTSGKTVSGSSKRKVYEYVNKMNIKYEQRLLLLGLRYSLNDTDKTNLANYINSLKVSKDEKLKMYEKIQGFTVYKNGRVTW